MANVQTAQTATATRKPAKGGKVNANSILANVIQYAAQAQVGLASVTGLPTIPAQTAHAAPVSLAAQLAAAQQASCAAAPAQQATARQPRQPAHTGGVFGHVCTVGRRAGKCWYATGSAGWLIGQVLCQHAAQGRKAALHAAVCAGFSAGSATSCWGDLQAFNASLQAAGLPSLQTAYGNVAPANANGVSASVA